VWALGQQDHRRGLEILQQHFFIETDSEVRWATIFSLMRLGITDNQGFLTRALNDSDPSVLQTTLQGMKQNGVTEPIERVCELQKHPHQEVRAAASDLIDNSRVCPN